MKTNIGVIFGGRSVEHEISVISALQAINAIDKNKYNVIPIYINKAGKWLTGDVLLEVETYKSEEKIIKECTEIIIDTHSNNFNLYKKTLWSLKLIASVDVVFPVIHGSNGEDGTLQGFLELKNIPYVGSNVLSSSTGMDKIVMKMILKESGLPVVDYLWFYDKEWHINKQEILKKINKLAYPLIVKPSNLGSSVGITTAKNEEELESAVELAGEFSNRILVEKLVSDLQEINCSVIGNSDKQNASVCEEPLKSGDILSYNDKYTTKGGNSKGMSSAKRQIPAQIAPELTKQIQELAKQTFKVLNSGGVARIDFLINKKDNTVYVNEINSIPGSLSFYLWEASDMDFTMLTNELIELALKQNREKENYMVSYNQNIFSLNTNSLKLGKG
ncbi:D-alanine--D-alanine ligase family protein [Maribellus maritimus]|uniref:D-alanine--D-alanine ligase family protein n=1 Tax=Maribellus maritimus TaxID=2870838 RepID=UPI001EEA69AC|nr:D-alanine--D-alanine ligase family protein [Maribellus maritimus]MCG6186380.1 D-alanine--D-alanine ligase [Maribellus maritimus]